MVWSHPHFSLNHWLINANIAAMLLLTIMIIITVIQPLVLQPLLRIEPLDAAQDLPRHVLLHLAADVLCGEIHVVETAVLEGRVFYGILEDGRRRAPPEGLLHGHVTQGIYQERQGCHEE